LLRAGLVAISISRLGSAHIRDKWIIAASGIALVGICAAIQTSDQLLEFRRKGDLLADIQGYARQQDAKRSPRDGGGLAKHTQLWSGLTLPKLLIHGPGMRVIDVAGTSTQNRLNEKHGLSASGRLLLVQTNGFFQY
jgi:hypothetical protein